MENNSKDGKNQRLENFATGDSILFLTSASESHGRVSHFLMSLAPGSDWAKTPVHFHRYQIETFKVLSGQLNFKLNGREMILNKNSPKIVVNEKATHAFWNSSLTQTVTFEAEIFNPKEIENSIRITYALSKFNKVNKRNIPKNPWITLILMYHFESYFRYVPWRLQKGVLYILYRISTLFVSKRSLDALIQEK
ncbi:MAG: hypothetical protein JJ975_11875 [Bacteroidia bacterium]|nr:hypothetical protein [Bacteroidia bacterium]